MVENNIIKVESLDKFCLLCGSNENRRVAINGLTGIDKEIVFCASCLHDVIDVIEIDTFG